MAREWLHALYSELESWAKVHDVEFHVDWHPDCHSLSVTHHTGTSKCRFSIFEFPHKGGCHEATSSLWHDDTILEFVDKFKKVAKPIQPTEPLGYVL